MNAKQNKSFRAQKMSRTSSKEVEDWIVKEAPLQININGKPFTVIMRTPGSDAELIKGLLYTERIMRDSDELKIIFAEDKDIASVWIEPHLLHEGYYQSRSLLSVSSCGICGKRELGDLDMDEDALMIDCSLDPEKVEGMFSIMEDHQAVFLKTGGAHAASCFDLYGELLAIQEDIGRHNAVDKVIGQLLDARTLSRARCLLVSGRVSYEIVCKCYRAGIPLLAAVSSPSSMSIEIADRKGITLLGFCRGDALTCYTHADRLATKSRESLK